MTAATSACHGDEVTAYAGYWLLPIPQTAFWTTHVPGWNPNPWVRRGR